MMTPEEQRIAIAEACPDLFVYVPSPFGPGGLHWKWGQDDNGKPVSPGAHVDPLSDLNAMHEAEKWLWKNRRNFKHYTDAWVVYKATLKEICGSDYFHATAAQRAEAFLRTLNLWI